MAERVGQVLSVLETPLSASLTVAAASGALVLTVDDVADFDETGGWLSLNGTAYQYDSTDDAANTITLTTGTTAAAAVDDVAYAWDHDHGRVLTTTKASVGCPEGPVTATVPPDLAPYLSRDMRGGPAESVSIDHPAKNPDAWEVTALHKQPGTDGVTPLYGAFTTRVDGEGAGLEFSNGGLVGYDSNGDIYLRLSSDPIGTGFPPVTVTKPGLGVFGTFVQLGNEVTSGKIGLGVGSTSGGGTTGEAYVVGDSAGNLYLLGQSIHVKDQTEASYKAINASAFNVSSDRATKTEFADPPDALAIIRDMPVYVYERKDEPGVLRYGVMADSAPAILQRLADDGTAMLDMSGHAAVLHQAVQQLDAQLNPSAKRKARNLKEKP